MYTDGGGAPGNQQTTGLRAHLRSLRNLPDYPNLDMKLDVAGRGEVNAAEYFCRFEDATDAHATPVRDGKARLMAYWGGYHLAKRGKQSVPERAGYGHPPAQEDGENLP